MMDQSYSIFQGKEKNSTVKPGDKELFGHPKMVP